MARAHLRKQRRRRTPRLHRTRHPEVQAHLDLQARREEQAPPAMVRESDGQPRPYREREQRRLQWLHFLRLMAELASPLAAVTGRYASGTPSGGLTPPGLAGRRTGPGGGTDLRHARRRLRQHRQHGEDSVPSTSTRPPPPQSRTPPLSSITADVRTYGTTQTSVGRTCLGGGHPRPRSLSGGRCYAP